VTGASGDAPLGPGSAAMPDQLGILVIVQHGNGYFGPTFTNPKHRGLEVLASGQPAPWLTPGIP